MLSKKTLELLAQADNMKAKYEQLMNELSDSFKEDTDGNIELCVPALLSQLHYNREKQVDILTLVRDIADDGAVEFKWSDKDCSGYMLKIDRHDFVIVLHKEDIK